MVLDGLYEATLATAAVVAQERHPERVPVFLTMVGGGVFQNRDEWIIRAIQRAMAIYNDQPLDLWCIADASRSVYEEALPVIGVDDTDE